MNPQDPTPSSPVPSIPTNKAPWLPWHRRIMREKYYLEYWLRDQYNGHWVCEFREISDDCIEYQDYVSRRLTVIKADHTIVYRLTRFS